MRHHVIQNKFQLQSPTSVEAGTADCTGELATWGFSRRLTTLIPCKALSRFLFGVHLHIHVCVCRECAMYHRAENNEKSIEFDLIVCLRAFSAFSRTSSGIKSRCCGEYSTTPVLGSNYLILDSNAWFYTRYLQEEHLAAGFGMTPEVGKRHPPGNRSLNHGSVCLNRLTESLYEDLFYPTITPFNRRSANKNAIIGQICMLLNNATARV